MSVSTSLTVWGLGFIALALAVVPSLRRRPWPLAMSLMFALAGVCAILVGPLRMDCSVITSAACKSRWAAGASSWHFYAHSWLSVGIKVALLASGFAFARSAWPSRLGRLVSGGALVLLVAGIVTFILHDSFTGYEGLEERLWAFVAQAWALACATVLILEATLTPDRLQAHEVSMQHRGSAEPAALDERVRFACASGSACSYRRRMRADGVHPSYLRLSVERDQDRDRASSRAR